MFQGLVDRGNKLHRTAVSCLRAIEFGHGCTAFPPRPSLSGQELPGRGHPGPLAFRIYNSTTLCGREALSAETERCPRPPSDGLFVVDVHLAGPRPLLEGWSPPPEQPPPASSLRQVRWHGRTILTACQSLETVWKQGHVLPRFFAAAAIRSETCVLDRFESCVGDREGTRSMSAACDSDRWRRCP